MIAFKAVQGLSEMDRRLSLLAASLADQIVETALSTAAEPMRREMAARAPRSIVAKEHLADNIIVARGSAEEAPNRASVEIGPEHRPDDFFYGYFQEFGTSRHRARPFARPAFDATIDETLAAIGRELWTGIEKVTR